MNVHYRERLLALEREIAGRTERESALGRSQTATRDSGGDSMAEQNASEAFSEAEADSATLQQVRDALKRIQDGTYGRCLVDGGPIEPKRLDAVPWAQYCLKHQASEEAGLKTPTL
ncbi:MAG: TraR/DksA C4-type zinc finger protein [Acidobacteriota bacterium]